MTTLKDRIITEIILREGGFVDHPSDKGGPTNHGITIAVARKHGYNGPMEKLPIELARKIYEKDYWDALSLGLIEKLSASIAEEVADTAVNMGVSRAGRFLQQSLNALNMKQALYKDMKVDGAVGPTTIAALGKLLQVRKAQGELVLLRMLNSLQGAFYIGLSVAREANEDFVFGWFLNRVEINKR